MKRGSAILTIVAGVALAAAGILSLLSACTARRDDWG